MCGIVTARRPGRPVAAGAVAVVIAGWTTSNPTLYRAGLALQAVTPNWPRWAVTLVAGASQDVIVQISIPGGVAAGTVETGTITVTGSGTGAGGAGGAAGVCSTAGAVGSAGGV